jgi:hypothetical protein
MVLVGLKLIIETTFLATFVIYLKSFIIFGIPIFYAYFFFSSKPSTVFWFILLSKLTALTKFLTIKSYIREPSETEIIYTWSSGTSKASEIY